MIMSFKLTVISALAPAIKDVAELGDGLTDIQAEQRTLALEQQKVHHWLSSPDPSSNHNATCKAHLANTGEWLLKNEEFEKWKMTSRSFLWLSGIRK
jgi:hypothetical protein